MAKFLNNFETIKKPAFWADSLESRNGLISPALTSFISIASQEAVSSVLIGDNFLSCGPAGNRTPEILMSKQDSNHSGPTAILLYQKSRQKENNISNVENVVFDSLLENTVPTDTRYLDYSKAINLVNSCFQKNKKNPPQGSVKTPSRGFYPQNNKPKVLVN